MYSVKKDTTVIYINSDYISLLFEYWLVKSVSKAKCKYLFEFSLNLIHQT